MNSFVVRPIRADEIDQIAAGIARNLAPDPTVAGWLREEWPRRIIARPGFKFVNCRAGIFHGRIVSHAMIEPYTLRYGKARLRVAGISRVYTEEGYRGRGFAAAVLRDALAYAVEQGAHLALLHGHRGYYDRFGFSPVWPRYFAEFDSAEVAALECPLVLRPARPDDAPQMAAMYERYWSGRVTFTRSPEIWAWRVRAGDDGRAAMVVVSEDDEVQGYIAARTPTDWQTEVVAETPNAALTLLANGGQWHLRAEVARIRWTMPPDDPLIAFAQQRIPVQLSAEFLPDGGWMARLIDAPGMIATLRDEIYTQARMTLPRLRPDDLLLESEAEGIQVGLRPSPSTHALLSQRDFVQVLFGSISPASLGLRSGLHLDSVQVLQAFFPPRVAALAAWDWF